MQNVIISPIFNQFMSGRIWIGLDYNKIKSELDKNNYATSIIPFKDLISKLDEIAQNSLIFYSSTYNSAYLKYIVDTIETIKLLRPDIVLAPNVQQLKSLDNKGHQEYYKQILGIERVRGKYYGDINDLIEDANELQFPFVLKKNEGALSSGVQLVKDKSELKSIQNKLKRRNLKERLAFWLNKRNSSKKDLSFSRPEHLFQLNFDAFFDKRTPVVCQEYIPNLKFDYKILQFGNKYYGLKRFTKTNDFRASGSGKISFEEIPESVLDFSRQIVKKFQTPFLSLDVGIDDANECFLFEFQGTAFGPLTLTESKFYYMPIKNGWKKIETASILENEYAYALDHFMKKLT